MEEFAITIKNDTTSSSNTQEVRLSFVLGRDYVVDTRSIQLATGSPYNFGCALESSLDFGDSGVWRRGATPVSTDESDKVYASMVNKKLWNLVLINFSADEAGVYTCSTHEFSQSIDISVGKCTERYIGELALSILEIYVVPYSGHYRTRALLGAPRL